MRVDTRCACLAMVAGATILIIAGLCSCGGNSTGSPGLQPSQPGTATGHEAAFSLREPGTQQTAGFDLSLVEHDGQVIVSVFADESLSPDAVLFELDYDPSHYTPQVVQATDAFCAAADSLTLEMLNEPGTVSFGQVPVGTTGKAIEPGAVLAEVLFSKEPFATRNAAAVPVHSGALCPLTYDADSGELTLHYVNPGDYDQNGVVSASDLVPIGRHYAEAGPFNFHSALSVIDGNNNGQIDVADITVIGQYWGNEVEAFNFYCSNDINDIPVGYAEPSTITPLGSVDFQAATGYPTSDRLRFTFSYDSMAPIAIHWARPMVDEAEGICSNLAGPEMITQLGSQSNALPVAQLSLDYTGLDAPAEVMLDASGSSDLDGVIAFYEWDFEGDGLYDAFGRDAIATHVYNHAGTFVPLVRITDNLGAWAIAQADPFTVTEVLQPNMPPIADIVATVTSGTAPLSVGFMASGSSDPDGYIAKYEWDFDGDGEFDLDSGADPTVIHEYTVAGDCNATVRATDDRGDSATDSVLISVADAPVPNEQPVAVLTANPPYGDAPITVTLDASGSFDPDGSIVKYEWDFDGDGNWEEYGTNPVVENEYTVPDVYEAMLRVTDDQGASKLISLSVFCNESFTDLGPWPMSGQNPRKNGRSPYPGSQTSNLHGTYFIGMDAVTRPVVSTDGTSYICCREMNDYRIVAVDKDRNVLWTKLLDSEAISLTISPAGELHIGCAGNRLMVLNPDGSNKRTYTTGGSVLTQSAFAADGSVYFGCSDGSVYTIGGNGFLAWTYPTGAPVWSSPDVGSDGTVYIGSNDDYLYALNPNGSLKWQYQTGDDVTTSPAVSSDGTIYFGSHDGYLYALNSDGTLKWSFDAATPIHASPKVDGSGNVYIGTDMNGLYAFDPDGNQIWSDNLNDIAWTTPSIASDGTLHIGGNDFSTYTSHLYAYYPNGSLKRKIETDYWIGEEPAVGSDGAVYINNAGSFRSYNPDESVLWEFPVRCQTWESPVLSRDNDVYLTCTYGNLYAFNPDCTPKWVFETSASRASPAIGIDGTVYACTDTGRLLALDSDGNLLWETDEGIAIDSPVIDFDGTIYVHNSTTMRAIDPDGSIRWQYGGSTRPAISQDGSLVVRGNPYQYLSEVDKEGWGTTIHGIESGEIGIPSIGTDGTIYVGGFRDLLAIGSEGLEWDYELGSVGQQLAIGPDGTILAVNGSGQLYALLPDGTEKWKLNTSNQITSAASIDSAGTLYAGRYKAGVPSVAAYSSQGEIIWSYTANGYVKGAPVIGSNGVVYAACVSGHLYAFGPGGS